MKATKIKPITLIDNGHVKVIREDNMVYVYKQEQDKLILVSTIPIDDFKTNSKNPKVTLFRIK